MAEKKPEAEKLLGANPAARHNYFIDEEFEAGMMLTGTEIKSLRATSPNLRDSFVEVRVRANKAEAWLVNAHIGPYTHGNIWNHEAIRRRKLLLHRHQIEKMSDGVTKGLSIVPLRIYLKNGIAKIELGMGRGKKKHDKRDTLKKKDAEREIDQAMKASKEKSRRGHE